jgi:hypothetical protein
MISNINRYDNVLTRHAHQKHLASLKISPKLHYLSCLSKGKEINYRIRGEGVF